MNRCEFIKSIGFAPLIPLGLKKKKKEVKYKTTKVFGRDAVETKDGWNFIYFNCNGKAVFF